MSETTAVLGEICAPTVFGTDTMMPAVLVLMSAVPTCATDVCAATTSPSCTNTFCRIPEDAGASDTIGALRYALSIYTCVCRIFQ